MTRRAGPPSTLRALTLAVAFSTACDSPADPEPPPTEVDLAALFQPPTAAEIALVETDWASRSPTAEDVRVELTFEMALGAAPGTARVLSHEVDGFRHYGAVVSPDGAESGSLPVLVYAHGGDQGVSIDEISVLALGLGERGHELVFVVPSFRSEPLRTRTATFVSGGAPSPWDRDVDDALALLDAALAHTHAADPERIAVVGLSRGAGVALLMSVRDPRIDGVVEFFGPTDFFGGFVQGVVAEVLAGRLPPLPGLSVLNDRFLGPLAAGALTIEQVRPELVRRSPVLFAERLARVQIHHGTADPVVEVSQAESLIAALERIGRGPPGDEFHIYPGGSHNPLTLAGSVPRATAFLDAVLARPAVGANSIR